MLFYDFEVFKHDWLVVIIDIINHEEHIIVNDKEKLQKIYDENVNNIWVGYNSRYYDQYILKGILCDFNPKKINDHIIKEKKGGWLFSNLFMQVPLNNYDIKISDHGLKQLEGFMGNNIKESSVPFDLDRKLTQEELEETIKYCRHDVEQTIEVFLQRKEEFESHMSLIKAFQLPLKYISKTKVQLSAIILDAHKQERTDEFDIQFPDTLKIEKYKKVFEWYKNTREKLLSDIEKLETLLTDDKAKRKWYSENILELEVCGVPHQFAWGGLHGALEKYSDEGTFLNVDVASYYPSLMIEYNYGSRNMSNPDKYKQIRDKRLELKRNKDPMQSPYKIVLNGTYGAMKDKYNNLYDPRQANNVCVAGQLLLLDLLEKLEGNCKIIQSNTDGILVKLFSKNDYEKIVEICHEWEKRTRMNLEFDLYTKVFQKDVNNYIIVDEKGGFKSKGAYVKKLNSLDYDLPIVNEAVREYMLHDTPVEETINGCRELIKFQRVVKLSGKYSYALYGTEKLNEKCLRVFASRNETDPGVKKVKEEKLLAGNTNGDKIENTPEHCFIVNENINDKRISRRLDRNWYISLAKKRLEDFGVLIKR